MLILLRKEVEIELTKLNEKPNNIFTLVNFMKKDGKDIEGGRCIKGKGRKLGFGKDRKGMWKNCMEEIMNKENNWDYSTRASMVEKPCEEMAIAMKPEKAAGPSEICAEMVSASGEVGIELCQCMLDGKEMLDESQTSVLVPIFKEKEM